jgi:hypothetical protein
MIRLLSVSLLTLSTHIPSLQGTDHRVSAIMQMMASVTSTVNLSQLMALSMVLQTPLAVG